MQNLSKLPDVAKCLARSLYGTAAPSELLLNLRALNRVAKECHRALHRANGPRSRLLRDLLGAAGAPEVLALTSNWMAQLDEGALASLLGRHNHPRFFVLETRAMSSREPFS